MGGLGKHRKGLTLLEILVSMILFTTVVVTSSAILSSFNKFYKDFMATQSLVGEISLGALEEIASKLVMSNEAVIESDSKVVIRIDERNTPSDFSDDTVHTYWKAGESLMHKCKAGKNSEKTDKIITKNVKQLKFELQTSPETANNRVKITIGVSSSNDVQYDFETTVVLRCRSAQAL